jgi:DNA-binding LacI/PurR family transcriptional regulator
LTEAPRKPEARLPTSAFAKPALDLILSFPARPTAIFAHNDALAIGLMESMKERGLKCPDDMAIVGFNNIDLGDVLATPLTTVEYPIADVGSHAGHLVRALIADPNTACESRTFRPRLVVRGSA